MRCSRGTEASFIWAIKMIGRRKLQRAVSSGSTEAMTQCTDHRIERGLSNCAQGYFFSRVLQTQERERATIQGQKHRPLLVDKRSNSAWGCEPLLVSVRTTTGQRVNHYWCVPLTYTGEDAPILTSGRDAPMKTSLCYGTKCHLWEHLLYHTYIIVRARERSKRIEAEEKARAFFADCGDKMENYLPYYRQSVAKIVYFCSQIFH